MVGKEPLQNYLSLLHEKVAETNINDSTLGTIFHKGMEVMMVEHMEKTGVVDMETEKSMHMELPNGWILSGTSDLTADNTDEIVTEIHDYKLTKAYALKMMLQQLSTHDYTTQLQVLDLLFQNENGPMTTKLICDMFIKDAKAVENEVSLTQVEVPKEASNTTIDKVVRITNELQNYVESGTVPPQCSDLWIRKVKGVGVPTKCALYCSHGKAGLCPYYEPTTRQTINRLVNW